MTGPRQSFVLERRYTVAEAAEILGLVPDTVYRLVERGELQHLRRKSDRRIFFLAQHLEAAFAREGGSDAETAE